MSAAGSDRLLSYFRSGGALRRELTEIPAAAPWIPGVSDASVLLAAVPADVVVQFGPLDLSRLGDTDQLATGRTFTQREIDQAYRRRRGARHHGLHATREMSVESA